MQRAGLERSGQASTIRREGTYQSISTCSTCDGRLTRKRPWGTTDLFLDSILQDIRYRPQFLVILYTFHTLREVIVNNVPKQVSTYLLNTGVETRTEHRFYQSPFRKQLLRKPNEKV